ncbi:MAG: hypothetical protein V1778_00260 [bacterium]
MKYLRCLPAFLLLLLPSVTRADLPNPLTDVTTIEDLIVKVSTGLIGLVAVAATFMFIYGGIMMLTSGGNEKRVSQAKDILKWTALGIVFLLLGGALIRFIYQALNAQNPNDISASIGLGTASLSATTLSILRTVLGLLGIIGVAMIIWGGYMWMTAAGNEKRIERAKQILTAAITGVVILLLSWAIVWFVIQSTTNVSK